MQNDKWIKTFIQSDGQVAVTAVPNGQGTTVVTAQTMIGGKMVTKKLYAGEDQASAQEAFDAFFRHEAETFLKEANSANRGAVAAAPAEEAKTDPADGQEAGEEESEEEADGKGTDEESAGTAEAETEGNESSEEE